MAYACADCNRTFWSEHAIESHCYAKGHSRTWNCVLCNRSFWSEHAYEQHCRDAPAHRWVTCQVCNRLFGSRSDYEKHCRQSQKHRERMRRAAQPVECHFCPKIFSSPSAYAQHIESGVHNVTRHHVTAAVQRLNIVPKVTIGNTSHYSNTPRLQFLGDSEVNPAAAAVATAEVVSGPPLDTRREVTTARRRPMPFAVVPAIVTYEAADFINLGIPYACPLCFSTFRTVFALTAHMNSPVHDPDAFKCPQCKKPFKLISGLIQHLESGACGLASIAEVQDRFARLTARFSNLITAM